MSSFASLESKERYARKKRNRSITTFEGVKITYADRMDFAKRILVKDYFFKEVQSKRRHHYIMNIGTKLIRVVYNPKFFHIVGFLPSSTCNERLFGKGAKS